MANHGLTNKGKVKCGPFTLLADTTDSEWVYLIYDDPKVLGADNPLEVARQAKTSKGKSYRQGTNPDYEGSSNFPLQIWDVRDGKWRYYNDQAGEGAITSSKFLSGLEDELKLLQTKKTSASVIDIQALLDTISEELEARGAVELATAVDELAIAADPKATEPNSKELVKQDKPEKKEPSKPAPKKEETKEEVPEVKPEPKNRPPSKGMVHWAGSKACQKAPGEKTLDPTRVTCKKCQEAMRQAGITAEASTKSEASSGRVEGLLVDFLLNSLEAVVGDKSTKLLGHCEIVTVADILNDKIEVSISEQGKPEEVYVIKVSKQGVV
jgi:hypothetical protein